MSGWNYRVLYREHAVPGSESVTLYDVHEVYYDDDGNPRAWSSDPISAHGESMEDVAADLRLMALALNKPALSLSALEAEMKSRHGESS